MFRVRHEHLNNIHGVLFLCHPGLVQLAKLVGVVEHIWG
jgi:hypothetical protein